MQFALVWGADPRIECEPQKWLLWHPKCSVVCWVVTPCNTGGTFQYFGATGYAHLHTPDINPPLFCSWMCRAEECSEMLEEGLCSERAVSSVFSISCANRSTIRLCCLLLNSSRQIMKIQEMRHHVLILRDITKRCCRLCLLSVSCM